MLWNWHLGALEFEENCALEGETYALEGETYTLARVPGSTNCLIFKIIYKIDRVNLPGLLL